MNIHYHTVLSKSYKQNACCSWYLLEQVSLMSSQNSSVLIEEMEDLFLRLELNPFGQLLKNSSSFGWYAYSGVKNSSWVDCICLPLSGVPRTSKPWATREHLLKRLKNILGSDALHCILNKSISYASYVTNIASKQIILYLMSCVVTHHMV